MNAKRFVLGLAAASLIAMGIQQCRAAEWDATDKVLFGSLIVLHVVDIAQTNDIHRQYPAYYEKNELYGKDPNMAAVIGIKTIATAGLYWIVKDMSSVDRKLLLTAANLLEVGVVANNYKIGLNLRF